MKTMSCIVGVVLLACCFGAHALTGSGDSPMGLLETVPPILDSMLVLSESSLVVSFSEPMLAPGVAVQENYTISGPGAGTLDAHPTVVTGDTLYTLTWDTGEMRGAAVTVTATGLQDELGNPINAAGNAVSGVGFGAKVPLRVRLLIPALLAAGLWLLMRRRRRAGALPLFLMAALVAAPAAPGQAPTVANVTFAQGPTADGTQVDIRYDLVAPNDPCNIRVTLSKDGGLDGFIHPVSAVRGDISGVVTGAGRRILWNIAADYPKENIPQARIRVTAEESAEHAILLPGNVPLVMVWTAAGTFMMGHYPGEQESYSFETPQHAVTLAAGCWLGKYELTQAQWKAVMGGANPSHFQGGSYGNTDNRPVEQVSWEAAQAFITTLNAHITATGQGSATMRLPSEAEWEYACRGGTTDRFYWGDDPAYTEIGTYAWHLNNSGNQTHDVGTAGTTGNPNAFGLYDMSGNVWEWCQDWYHSTYAGAPTDGSAWESPVGAERVGRGGSWNNLRGCRSASRTYAAPSTALNNIGFRLAKS